MREAAATPAAVWNADDVLDEVMPQVLREQPS